jgi:hypothetical protein
VRDGVDLLLRLVKIVFCRVVLEWCYGIYALHKLEISTTYVHANIHS